MDIALSRVHESAYNHARDNVDSLIGDNSDQINAQLKIIGKYRAQVMVGFVRAWRTEYSKRISNFDLALDWSVIHDNLNAAYADYIRYAFYYRFSNTLKDNILFRKVLSFEIHFFCKRHVFTSSVSKSVGTASLSADANAYHTSPIAHFLAFRILNELIVKLQNLASLEKNLTAFTNFITLNRAKMLEFFQRYTMTNSDFPKLDDFREYLEEPQNSDWNAIIEHIEKQPYLQRSAF